jgi:hypothetical protein
VGVVHGLRHGYEAPYAARQRVIPPLTRAPTATVTGSGSRRHTAVAQSSCRSRSSPPSSPAPCQKSCTGWAPHSRLASKVPEDREERPKSKVAAPVLIPCLIASQ